MDRDRVVALDKLRVWHPYTEMGRYRAHVDPLVVVRAEGSRLFDADGRSYLDGNASWWTATLGHRHPRLVAALKQQADTLCHTALAGIAHPNASRLAERLCAVAPRGLEHVFFSDNGSTAVEVAMKMALQYWAQNGRPRRKSFVALEGGFHGETLGATAVGGVEVFRRPFEGALLDCVHVPSPADPSGGALDRSLEALRRAVLGAADRVAGVVLESMVQGAAGMQIYSADFLREARAICDEADVFLIADEVFAGYGRTGPMWACEHAGVAPDALCTAKGFTGGVLPMSATLATERIFEGFLGDADRAFYYGHTFCGNPLGAAVALAVLDVLEEEKVLERARDKALRIARSFERMASLPGVARTRSLGMIGALDLAGDAGYLVRPLGNVVYVTPPLNIPDDDLDRLLSIVEESVARVAGRS